MISFSLGVKFQSTVLFLNLNVMFSRIIAAATDIFRLSVKPTIGIFKKPSALFITSSETPDFSTPNTKADFLVKSKLFKIHDSLCGEVAIT
jgi:hypothetical protein